MCDPVGSSTRLQLQNRLGNSILIYIPNLQATSRLETTPAGQTRKCSACPAGTVQSANGLSCEAVPVEEEPIEMIA